MFIASWPHHFGAPKERDVFRTSRSYRANLLGRRSIYKHAAPTEQGQINCTFRFRLNRRRSSRDDLSWPWLQRRNHPLHCE